MGRKQILEWGANLLHESGLRRLEMEWIEESPRGLSAGRFILAVEPLCPTFNNKMYCYSLGLRNEFQTSSEVSLKAHL